MKKNISATISSKSSESTSSQSKPNQDDQFHFEPRFDQPFPHVSDKGSLALRSERNIYGRGVFVSGWHEAREAEPKEVDINKAKRRDMFRSTYHRIGDDTDGSLPLSTYTDLCRDHGLLKRFREQEWRKPLVKEETFSSSILDRETGHAKTGFHSVLPHAPTAVREYMTTTIDDYRPYYPLLPGPPIPVKPDWSRAVKRTVSQFTDTDTHRRKGHNSWFDESGHYFNSHLKAVCPYFKRRLPPFNERF